MIDGLQTAIERGKFHRSSGRVDAMTVLAVADDIASGMTFLHSHGVLHGNLSSASVLLAFSQVPCRCLRIERINMISVHT